MDGMSSQSSALGKDNVLTPLTMAFSAGICSTGADSRVFACGTPPHWRFDGISTAGEDSCTFAIVARCAAEKAR